jgi:hypothetical protein
MTRLYLLAGGEPLYHRCAADVDAEVTGPKTPASRSVLHTGATC